MRARPQDRSFGQPSIKEVSEGWEHVFEEDVVTKRLSGAYRGFYGAAFTPDWLEGLTSVGLLDTRLVDDDLKFVTMAQRRIKLPTMHSEWTGTMRKDAALLTLKMLLYLDRMGHTLADGHAGNILFDGSQPRFVDLGSLLAKQSEHDIPGWHAAGEFVSSFCLPLVYHCCGRSDRLRDRLRSPMRQLRLRNLVRDIGPTCLPLLTYVFALGRCLRYLPLQFAANAFRIALSNMSVHPTRTIWQNYHHQSHLETNCQEWTQKHESITEIIKLLRPKTVVDIGANAGAYSLIAAMNGAQVVAIDSDEGALERLYKKAKGEKLHVTPVLMDAFRPTPQFHPIVPPAVVRFQGDLMIALAIMHHLIYNAGMPLEVFLACLYAYRPQNLAIEYVPPDYSASFFGQLANPPISEQLFAETLGQRYHQVLVWPSHRSGHKIFLCSSPRY